jgi:hypothetical protein
MRKRRARSFGAFPFTVLAKHYLNEKAARNSETTMKDLRRTVRVIKEDMQELRRTDRIPTTNPAKMTEKDVEAFQEYWKTRPRRGLGQQSFDPLAPNTQRRLKRILADLIDFSSPSQVRSILAQSGMGRPKAKPKLRTTSASLKPSEQTALDLLRSMGFHLERKLVGHDFVDRGARNLFEIKTRVLSPNQTRELRDKGDGWTKYLVIVERTAIYLYRLDRWSRYSTGSAGPNLIPPDSIQRPGGVGSGLERNAEEAEEDREP